MNRTLSSFLALTLAGTLMAEETINLSIANRIKTEAFYNSQIMDHLFYLADVYGPRLNNSPGHKAAASWAIERLKGYGLTNAKLEGWGPFGQSWQLKHFSAHMIMPQYAPLIGFPLAWTGPTAGPVQADVTFQLLRNEADLEKAKGKIRGKIVLAVDKKVINPSFEPLARRLSDADLLARTNTLDPSRSSFGPATPPVDREALRRFRARVNQFLIDEGAVAMITYGTNGDGGTVFGTDGGSRDPKDPVPPPTIVLTPEHYNRMARLIEHQIPVRMELDVQVAFLKDNLNSFNVIAEIPGTDKKEEVVMLGGHLDSWHASTGATDNATGVSVAIEAVRILKSLQVPLRRTVRIALWGGEEQGLLGSMAYVQEHFANRQTMQPTTEYSKLSAYYNDDTGTGRFRGISIGGNDMVKPIFEKWLEPFHDLGAKTIAGTVAPPTRQPGGTDHTSFTWIGLPGFGFLQDPMEYATRTHHSNMDNYDRVVPGDVMQAAAIMAWFVYNTANREEMMPRVPMPKPLTSSTTNSTSSR
ncbi:M20/M25/M40 family metallo-hydrolase [Bryobacter aggregatus]|uniref:M20/M25/M40 family metallo-hydrolase n=1 Tax=Bryobacter aggregatus TaxID=360054 RepID=UPI000ACB6B10|nr:M20/M25/M40 family metallo-hydrolase [Bryobacter aggregatus]